MPRKESKKALFKKKSASSHSKLTHASPAQEPSAPAPAAPAPAAAADIDADAGPVAAAVPGPVVADAAVDNPLEAADDTLIAADDDVLPMISTPGDADDDDDDGAGAIQPPEKKRYRPSKRSIGDYHFTDEQV